MLLLLVGFWMESGRGGGCEILILLVSDKYFSLGRE